MIAIKGCIKNKYLLGTLLLVVVASLAIYFMPGKTCVPQQREIAITMDDLPLVESTEHFSPEPFSRIVHSFVKHHAPVTGFVIANQINPEQLKILGNFRDQGFSLGNHSYSHMSLRETPADVYIEDLARADKILAPLITEPKYFRYPYLSQGRWGKRRTVREYLARNNYIIAPVTVDSKDYEFNMELYPDEKRNNKAFMADLRQRYLDFVWKQTVKAEQEESCKTGKQILMLHARLLNSYFLDDLLKMYEDHGYRFITLQEALAMQG